MHFRQHPSQLALSTFSVDIYVWAGPLCPIPVTEKHLIWFRYLPYKERWERLLPSINHQGIQAVCSDAEVCSPFGHGTSHPLWLSTRSSLFTAVDCVKELKNSRPSRPAFQFLVLQGVLCCFWRRL